MANFAAVAFDIDGTLYEDWKIQVLVFPYVLRHRSFFSAFARVRKTLHKKKFSPDFFSLQADLLAAELRVESIKARELAKKIVYDGLSPFFERITPCRDAYNTIAAFKNSGLKIALLSDFPPEQKGSVWGIAPLCDAVLSSEKTGALKPNAAPFDALADALGEPREKILYVGNSVHCDVRGAHGAGFKTAYFMPFWRRILSKPLKEADFSFKSYRQLQKIVLE